MSKQKPGEFLRHIDMLWSYQHSALLCSSLAEEERTCSIRFLKENRGDFHQQALSSVLLFAERKRRLSTLSVLLREGECGDKPLAAETFALGLAGGHIAGVAVQRMTVIGKLLSIGVVRDPQSAGELLSMRAGQ